MGFWKAYRKGEVCFSSHRVRGTRHPCDVTGDVNLDCIIKVVFARSLPCQGEELTLECLLRMEHGCRCQLF